MRILTEDTLCIIIDDQQKLIPTIFQHKELISNTKKLISGLLSLNIPVLITEHYKKGLGETVSELKEILSTSEQAKFFEKITFSAYDTAEIKEYINALNKKMSLSVVQKLIFVYCKQLSIFKIMAIKSY